MPSSRQLRRLVPGFIAVALVCRTPITSVPPALGAVRSGLDLSPTLAGLTTTLPLLCFGIMAFATPWLVARWGTERTTLVALVVAGVGILTRSAPTVGTFYLGATLMGAGIAILNVVLPAIVRSRLPQQVPRMTSTYTVCMIFGASVAAAVFVPVNPALKGSQVAYILGDCDAAYVVLPGEPLPEGADRWPGPDCVGTRALDQPACHGVHLQSSSCCAQGARPWVGTPPVPTDGVWWDRLWPLSVSNTSAASPTSSASPAPGSRPCSWACSRSASTSR